MTAKTAFFDIPGIYRLKVHWPVEVFDFRTTLWSIFTLFVLLLAGILIVRHADHGLLFGCLTVFAALAAAATFVSVFARRSVEDQAGRTFLILAGLGVFVLTLTAHDWARRQFLFAAAVTAAALSIFIVRIGYESLKVPPQWERVQVAARAIAAEDALKRQYQGDPRGLINSVQGARTALSGIVKSTQPLTVDKPLLDKAKAILAHSEQVFKGDKAEDPKDFSQFFTRLENLPAAAQPPVVTMLADAVRTLQTAESAAALDQAICPISPSAEKCGTKVPKITKNSEWVAERHELDVQLAAFRAQVTGTDAAKAALKAVLAQQPDVDEDISIMSAIENGPETLWRSAHHASGPALVPGPLGWVVLGAVLLGLLAWLLRVNASQLAGPVSVMPDQSDNGGKSGVDDKLVSVLRVAVLRNVSEPGAAPGSPSINPVTTLLDAAGGPLSAVSKAVQAVLGVIGQRYGYKVTVDVTSGGAATGASTGADTTTVLVRVMSLTSGVTYASHLCTSPDDKEAVRTAGLWAAGFILNRSTRIPHWAAWQAHTAHALVTAKDTTTGHTIPALRTALMDAPNSGLLLVLLGHHYELAGQTLDAIECYARAVTAYPRYVVARYRLAEALASMRHRQDWTSQDKDKRQDALRAVIPAIGVLRTKGDCEIRAIGENDRDQKIAKESLGKLAITLLRALEIDTRWYHRLVGALRRSERASIWPTLAPNSSHPAARFHPLVKSARQAIDYERWLDKLSRKADTPDTWWQVSYNAACGYAMHAESLACLPPAGNSSGADQRKDARGAKQHAADKALDFLEQTLVRPGVEQLSADWASRDPDLAVLAPDPRFQRFLAQLRPGA